jgi:phosphatidate phosphatase PAH1
MVPQKHTEELARELPNLDLIQGYLVPKDANPNLPIEQRAEGAVPGITYASMRVSVQPVDASMMNRPASPSATESTSDKSSSTKKKSNSSSESSKESTKGSTEKTPK